MCWVLRIFLLSLGILSLVAGVYCLTHAFRLHRSIENMKKPLNFFPVDLTKPQLHEVSLPAFEDSFHGFNLIVETNADFVSKEQGEKLLEGLQGKVTIETDGSISNIDFTKDDFFCVPYSDYALQKRTRFESIDFYRGETGCELSIAIYQGALNLNGIEQTLKIKCNPYGSESFILLICTVLGACLTIIGLGIIILLSVLVKRSSDMRENDKMPPVALCKPNA
jgi:hypothetical protein